MKIKDPLFGANHLTAVRWGLAGLVALGHIWLLTTGHEPFRIHNWTGSYMAVNGFFILSGLLIAKSLHSRRNVKAYAASRFLRIYPAFILIAFAFALFFSPLFSDPGGVDSVFAPETWKYVLRVLTLGDPENAPGGVFPNGLEKDFNGPLWTIRFEIAAYIMAALAFVTGAVRGFRSAATLFVVIQITYLSIPTLVDYSQLPSFVMPLLRLSTAFLMGMTLWHWPAARRPLWWLAIAFVVAFLVFGSSPIGELLANISLAALIMHLGLSKRSFEPLVNLPDYSYGIYIWHYPVMQAFLHLQPELGPWGLMTRSVPTFILLAGLSWHFFEKPILKLKPGTRKSSPISVLKAD